MKVLMTADTVGGVFTYAVELARGLERQQVDVVLCTLGAFLTADQRDELSGLDNVELHESDFRLEWQRDSWRDVERSADWLLQIAERARPDVVHLNTYAHGRLPFCAPKLVVAHSCVCSWWAAVKQTVLPQEWQHYRREVARGLQAADAVVAPSRAMLESLEACYGPVRDGRVIYNGRDASGFAPGRKEPFVLMAGRLWDEAKNAGALVEVADRSSWPVYLAGEGGPPSGRVRHLGRLSSRALAGWYSRAAIYCLPARYEPFGLTVLEAALSGCALVLGDIDSLREIWDGAAVFVPPNDTSALAEAIERLAHSERARDGLGDCARRRGLTLTQIRMAGAYASLYRELWERRSTEVDTCGS